MKCANCGGEIDSQAIVCVYCGSRNEEGLAFYREVYRRVQRNRLLAPVLLRQKTPQMIQRMLTRIIVGMGMLGMVLLGISLGLYLLVPDPAYSDARPDSGSYAAEYVDIADDYNNLSYRSWIEYSNIIMDTLDRGETPGTNAVRGLLEYGFRIYYAEEMDAQLQAQARLQVDAMLRGVLELGEEEMALFHKADERYAYSVSPDMEAQQQLVSLIEDRLKARLAEEWEE